MIDIKKVNLSELKQAISDKKENKEVVQEEPKLKDELTKTVIVKYAKDDKVKLNFNNKERTASFIEYCGRTETGKVRIKIVGDSKKYREVAQEKITKV